MNNKKLQHFSPNDKFSATKKEQAGNYFIALGRASLDFDQLFTDEMLSGSQSLVCPKIVFDIAEVKASNIHQFEGYDKGSGISVVKLYTPEEGVSVGAGTYLSPVNNNGSVIEGDISNQTEKKSCKIEKPASEIFDSDSFENIFDIVITAYKDGRYFISIDGEGGYVNAPDSDGFVWKKYSRESGYKTFVIRETELEEIKNAYPYNTLTTCNRYLRLSPIKKGLSTYYAISVNQISDSTGDDSILDNNYDVNTDDRFSFNFDLSQEKGVCTSYLGHADMEDTIANLLNRIYLLIKVGSIVLVIVLSMLEFAGSVTKGKDNLMEIIKKFAKRLIILVIILLLPTFIDMLANLFGIEDILCGIK